MNCWNRVVQTLAGSGKPVLYADFQFGGSGGFLVYNGYSLGYGLIAAGVIALIAAFVAAFKFQNTLRAKGKFRRAP